MGNGGHRHRPGSVAPGRPAGIPIRTSVGRHDTCANQSGMTRPHAGERLGFPHQRMHKVTGSTRPPGVVVILYTAGSFGPGSAAPADEGLSAEDDQPEIGDVPSVVAHRVGGGLVLDGPGQRPTGRSRCRTPGEPAALPGARERSARGIEGGVPVAPAVGRESRAHSGTATRERQSGRGSWSSLTWCREPKPPRVMRWLTTQVSGQCPLPRTIPGRPPAAGCECEQPITVPDSDGHGLFNRGGYGTSCEFLGRVLGVSSVIGVSKCFRQFTSGVYRHPRLLCPHANGFLVGNGSGLLDRPPSLGGRWWTDPRVRAAHQISEPRPGDRRCPALALASPIDATAADSDCSHQGSSVSDLELDVDVTYLDRGGNLKADLLYGHAAHRTPQSLHRPNRHTPARGKLS